MRPALGKKGRAVCFCRFGRKPEKLFLPSGNNGPCGRRVRASRSARRCWDASGINDDIRVAAFFDGTIYNQLADECAVCRLGIVAGFRIDQSFECSTCCDCDVAVARCQCDGCGGGGDVHIFSSGDMDVSGGNNRAVDGCLA